MHLDADVEVDADVHVDVDIAVDEVLDVDVHVDADKVLKAYVDVDVDAVVDADVCASHREMPAAVQRRSAHRTKLGRSLPKLVDSGTTSAELGIAPDRAKSGRDRPNFGQHRPELDKFRPPGSPVESYWIPSEVSLQTYGALL